MPLILGLLGSPLPRGNTAMLLERALAGAAEAGCTVERVNVPMLTFEPCMELLHCMNAPECAQIDDMTAIFLDRLAGFRPGPAFQMEVIEATLVSFHNLSYPNKHIYFLDDTRYDLSGDDAARMVAYRNDVDALCERIGIPLFRRKWRGAKAGMINDFLAFTESQRMEGFEFQSHGGTSPTRLLSASSGSGA